MTAKKTKNAKSAEAERKEWERVEARKSIAVHRLAQVAVREAAQGPADDALVSQAIANAIAASKALGRGPEFEANYERQLRLDVERAQARRRLILSREERRDLWSTIAANADVDSESRRRASELLNKSHTWQQKFRAAAAALDVDAEALLEFWCEEWLASIRSKGLQYHEDDILPLSLPEPAKKQEVHE